MLEDAVLKVRSEVSLQDAANIQTALRWERHAALAQRWLTKQYDELRVQERIAFSREIGKASSERDKAIGLLRLKREQSSPWIIDAHGTDTQD